MEPRLDLSQDAWDAIEWVVVVLLAVLVFTVGAGFFLHGPQDEPAPPPAPTQYGTTLA